MIRQICFLSAICILLCLTGCDNPFGRMIEIDDMMIIRVIGVDKAEDSDNLIVTVASKSIKTEEQSGTKDKSYTVSGEGKTIDEAIKKMSKYSDKNIFLGHTKYILLGESAINENFKQSIVFFIHQHQLRLNSNVLVTRGTTAKDIIKSTNAGQPFISDKLDLLYKETGTISTASEVQLHDLFKMLYDKNSSPYIPYIVLSKSLYGEKEKFDIAMEGFALFKDNNFIDYISGDDSKAFNLIINKFDSGITVVKDKSGQKVSLEIIEAKTKIKPVFQSNNLFTMKVMIKLTSNIGEQHSDLDIYNEESLKELEEQQKKIIESQVEKVLKYAQSKEMDVFNVWDKVYHKHPVKYKRIEDKWIQIFSDMSFTVDINSKINRTYIVNKHINNS